jgi:hypothetical protein
MGGGMGGMGRMGLNFSRVAGQTAEELGLALSSPDQPRFRAGQVPGENVVEVVDLRDGVVANRFTLPGEVEQVELDPTGAQLLATGADRSLSVYEVDSGTLLNAIRVERGPVPDARFGAGGEVILSNLGARGGGPGRVPGLGWRSPAAEPVAMLPVNPGRVLLEEVGHRLDAGRVPVDDGPVPVAWIVNVPPYPPPRPWGAGRVTIDTRVMPAPWEEGNRLVRIVLATRPPGSDLDDPVVPRPPVVAEGVVARVEFNPGRVASYRPIGFETRPSPASAIVGGRDWLRAGDLTTLLIEVEPIAEAVVAGAPIAERARSSRYLAVAPEARDELCSITLSYREPGREGRRTVEHPVLDAVGPIAEAPEDVRLASAIAWFGLALGGAVGDVPGALDGASRLVEGIDEDFLPETRRELIGLIGRARSLVQEDEEGPGNPPE